MVSFVAMSRFTTRRLRRPTAKRSGVTSPPTTDSPSPQDELITIRRSEPVTGSTVNSTPEASALISRWTTTANAKPWVPTPCRAR